MPSPPKSLLRQWGFSGKQMFFCDWWLAAPSLVVGMAVHEEVVLSVCYIVVLSAYDVCTKHCI